MHGKFNLFSSQDIDVGYFEFRNVYTHAELLKLILLTGYVVFVDRYA